MLKQQPLCDLYGSIDVKGAFVCVPINWKSSNDRLSSDMMDVVSWWNSNSPSNHQKRTIHKHLIEGNIVRSTVSNSGLNDYNCSIWSLFMVNQYSLMNSAVCSLHMIPQSMLIWARTEQESLVHKSHCYERGKRFVRLVTYVDSERVGYKRQLSSWNNSKWESLWEHSVRPQ